LLLFGPPYLYLFVIERAVVSSVAYTFCSLLFDCIYRHCNVFHFSEDDRLGRKLGINLLENHGWWVKNLSTMNTTTNTTLLNGQVHSNQAWQLLLQRESPSVLCWLSLYHVVTALMHNLDLDAYFNLMYLLMHLCIYIICYLSVYAIK